MSGRFLRSCAPTLLVLAVCLAACRPAQPARPNIVLILADTLRADYLGFHGFQGDISPHLDRLASESIVFENCLAQAPWTKPSVASLFTSTYPRVHKLTNHDGMFWGDSDEEARTGVLPDALTTLAESLRHAGYRTAGFVTNPWVDALFGFAQGFEVFDNEHMGRQVPGDVVLAAARDWLAARETDEPFFLYVHLMDVHDPYDAPIRDSALLHSSPSLGGDLPLSEAPPAYLLSRQDPNFTDDAKHKLKFWRSRYAANVRSLDRKLSFFIDYLRSAGLLDTSVLVFTSDHGDELHEHGGWTHGFTLHHHQLHVPLLIRNPGGAGGGRRVETGVELIDLMPTLIARAGAVVPQEAQGRDLSGWLNGTARQEPAYRSWASAVRLIPNMYALRTERYSLLVHLDTDEAWLYDRTLDPGEQWNIATREPERVAELRQQLATHLMEMDARDAPEPVQTPVDDEDLRQRLKALGYAR